MSRNPIIIALLLAASALPASANVYTVVNTQDSGAGSLRWAITEANNHAGADQVSFNIPGSGVRVIALQTPLPSLAAQTSILGNTQPGYAGAPLVRIDGGDLAGNAWGLDISGDSVTVHGLQIVRFQGPGIRVWSSFVTVRGSFLGTDGTTAMANLYDGIRCFSGNSLVVGGIAQGDGNVLSGNAGAGLTILAECGNAVVWGNRIGTNPAGTAAIANGNGGVRLYGSGNVVGGSAAAMANVISGNAFSGLHVGEAATGNDVVGNRIGTNAAGTAALANGSGIWVDGDDNRIGDWTAGSGNLISGNAGPAITIDEDASGNFIQGNRIGTDAAGNADLGNDGDGIRLYGGGNTIGGAVAGARNVISGNVYNGIVIFGPEASGNAILGNYLGTNAAGTAALPNDSYGIRAMDGTGNTISGNLISGNARAFSLEFGANGYVVQGNIIGLNAAGTAKLPNLSNGLDISSPGHLVGGDQPGAGNVIAGNDWYGIWIDGAGATGNVIAGNRIGTNAAGAANLGNDLVGVAITESSGNRIGGTAPGEGNVIAHNGYLGIYVWSGSGNAILGNSIHDNVLLGIDLDPQGPVPNDPGDWDGGPNLGQNFPVVTSAVANGGDLEIEGFLDGHPSTEYRIELFSSSTFDPTGVGEGEHYLGAVTATTGANGRVSFATTVAAAGGDAFVTATATSPSWDTSEFSPAIAVGAPQPGQLQIWRDLLLSYEGTPGIEVTVVRSHGVAGAVSVDVATVDGSAHAPGDYGALDTTLTFAAGETMKSVFVPVVTDGVAEGDESWRLQLANPQGGATLGANDDILAWLFDATLDFPMYSVSDAQVVEGDGGSRFLVFTVTLSPTDHPLAIDWWTTDGTALAGEDYVEAEGQLQFQPGDGPKTITLEVLGDLDLESDESLYVHLYGLGNCVVWDGLGEGRVLDDDGGGLGYLFADDFESGGPESWSSIAGFP